MCRFFKDRLLFAYFGAEFMEKLRAFIKYDLICEYHRIKGECIVRLARKLPARIRYWVIVTEFAKNSMEHPDTRKVSEVLETNFKDI